MLSINIVGNSYQKNKPSKHDKIIKFIDEPDNKFDANAIAVYSIRKHKNKKLGYVSKNETNFIRKFRKKINVLGIIKKINLNIPNYYSVIIEIN